MPSIAARNRSWNRPAYVAGGGGATIASGSQFRHLDFTGLSSGQSITALPGISYGTQGGGAFAGGTSGCYGDTAVKRAGKSSSLRLSLISGSTGRPVDGADPQEGDFGFIVAMPTPVVDGGDIRFGEWAFFPTGFNFSTNAGYLKTHRFDTNSGGKIEYEILCGLLDGLSPVGDPYGSACFYEAFPQAQSETCRLSDTVTSRGTWHWIEQYVHVSSVAASSIRRVWLDNTLIVEEVGGNSMKWRNTGGTYTTSSFASPVPTLVNSSENVGAIYLHTYWNGGAPQAQSRYVSNCIISNNNESATDLITDSFGNKMIGNAYI